MATAATTVSPAAASRCVASGRMSWQERYRLSTETASAPATPRATTASAVSGRAKTSPTSGAATSKTTTTGARAVSNPRKSTPRRSLLFAPSLARSVPAPKSRSDPSKPAAASPAANTANSDTEKRRAATSMTANAPTFDAPSPGRASAEFWSGRGISCLELGHRGIEELAVPPKDVPLAGARTPAVSSRRRTAISSIARATDPHQVHRGSRRRRRSTAAGSPPTRDAITGRSYANESCTTPD